MESTEGTRARRAVPLRATERRGVPRLIEVLCTGPDGYRVHSLPRGIGRTWVEHEQR